MPAFTIIPGDALLTRIDALVKARRAEAAAYRPDKKEEAEAARIRSAKGVAAANKYLASCRPGRVSRMGVTVELVEAQLDLLDAARQKRGVKNRRAVIAA